jgi:hypothetical protein
MNKQEENRKEILIGLLIDPNVLGADRDDAAMDLGEEFDDETVLNVLIQVAINPKEINMILNSCGEAIGRIWVRKSYFDDGGYRALPGIVRYGIYVVIKSRKPEWIEQYQLEMDKF